jgi:hypothetical protein
MRDCVVVGCGRSGTSLAAGLLARAGYNCGDDLLPPDEGGPTGYFESRRVNEINEALLAPHDHALLDRNGYSRPLRDGERWLAVLPPDAKPSAPEELRASMADALPASPYCCKDPRFGYTLEAWRPLLAGALFVCVFRHPLATARSIAREVRYGDLSVATETALDIWMAIHSRILGRLRHDGEWLFVHYEQLLDGSGVHRLARALEAPLDPTLADPALRTSTAGVDPPPGAAETYAELCASAGYAP